MAGTILIRRRRLSCVLGRTTTGASKMANLHAGPFRPPAARAGLSGCRPTFFAWIYGLSTILAAWTARSRQRRELRDLARGDADLLADIGLTRRQAYREGAKWFWQE